MIDLLDPVQRHIHAIATRDTIVPGDAADLKLGAVVSPKQLLRIQRAMLPGVDFVGDANPATLDDPVGRRVGRVAFNQPLRALWVDGLWTGTGPAPHRLPDNAASIEAFIRQQTHLADDCDADRARAESLLCFSIAHHARVTDLLRAGGAGARLFIAASMLSAACASFEKARHRTCVTGRQKDAVDMRARCVEAALIGTARIATDILLTDQHAPAGVRRIATHLVDQVEAVRRIRPSGNVARAVRIARAAADGVQLWLTRGILRDVPLAHDRDPGRLRGRLAMSSESLANLTATMIGEVAAVDPEELYVLLMARRLEVALMRHRWLAAPHPVFRLGYGYAGGHALFAELERLGAILTAMADRHRLADGASLDSVAFRPAIAEPAVTQAELAGKTTQGRYLALGAYHRAVTTGFIQRHAHWLATTARDTI